MSAASTPTVHRPTAVGLVSDSRFVSSVAEINEVRAREPQRIGELLAVRERRSLFGDDGKLMIVACDHPARGALGASGKKNAMADRLDLLDRLATALARPPLGPVAAHLVVTVGILGTVLAVLAVLSGAPERFVTTELLVLALAGLVVAGRVA